MSNELGLKLFCMGVGFILFFYALLMTIPNSCYFKKKSSKKSKCKNLDKKGLTIWHKAATLIKISISVVMIMLCFDNAVNQISIICTILGVSCFQLYDFFIKNSDVTCSINFRHKIENRESCKLRYAKGLDDCLVMNAVLLAFIPIMLMTVIGSILPSVAEVDIWTFVLIFFLYLSCCVKSFSYIQKIEDNKLIMYFAIPVVVFLLFFCITWVLPRRNFQDVSFMPGYVIRYGLLLVSALFGFIGIYKELQNFQHRKLPCVECPRIKGEIGNYFEIKLKNGDIINSKEEFFYPVSCKEGVLLLYLNGTSLIISESDLEDVKNPVYAHQRCS